MTYTVADYRTDLAHKLLAMEDGGYGDFAFEDTDLSLFLDLSVSRLYPAIYKKKTDVALPLVSYGTNLFWQITPTFPERVYRIEDTVERSLVLGWMVSGSDIINIDNTQSPSTANIVSVNAYYHDSYALPTNDSDDVGLAAVYKPLVVLGALIEALESRQDTGVRGDPPPTGNFSETQLLDRLIPRYDKMVERMAMGLPAVSL